MAVSKGDGKYSNSIANFSLYSFCVALESVVNLSGHCKTWDCAFFAIDETDFECNVST